MNNKIHKYFLYSCIFILLAVYAFFESQNKGDLSIYMAASKDLFSGGNIFVNKYIDGYHYFYSVFFAILIYPLSLLPVSFANLIWILINLVLVRQIFLLIKNLLPLNNFTQKELMFLRIGGFVFSIRFIHENIHCMQVTIFLLFLCLMGLKLIFSNKPFSGAALIAVGINIKLLPIVLLPYIFYRGFFKAGVFMIVVYFFLLFIPSFIIGWDFNLTLISTWKNLINPMNAGHILDTEERSFHGLSTLLSTLLVQNVPDAYAMHLKRNIADISLENLSIILNMVRLALISLTLYFLRTFPFKNSVSMAHRFREISYLLLLIPLIFPHQQHYNFLFICPAFIYCLYSFARNHKLINKNQKYLYLSIFIAVYLLCNLKLIAGAFNEYFEHYKILTYGALLLIPLLMISRTENSKEFI